MDFGAISWLGVVLAAVAFFVVGGIWYAPLFGKLWMRLTGIDEQTARRSNLPLIFGATAILGLVAAVGLAAVIGDDASPGRGLWVGAAIGVLIVATTLAIQSLYERKSLGLWALNAGYNVLGFAVMGLIVGALQ